MGKSRTLFLLVALFCNSFLLQAQWTYTNGPSNNYIWGIQTIGNNIFAATVGSGVFRSTNQGLNWTSASNGITNSAVQSFTYCGNKLFVGTGWDNTNGGGVFISTNNGDNWSPSLNGKAIYALASSGNNVIAGTYHLGIYLTTDLGATWNAINNGLPLNLNYYSLAIKGNEIFVGLSNGYGIYHSTDLGANWTNVTGGLLVNNVRALAFVNNVIFAGSDGQAGVFFSTDGGTTWTHSLSGMSVYSITSSSNKIFAGTNLGVYASTDNGISWLPYTNGMASTEVGSLGVTENYLFAGTMNNGIWRRLLTDVGVVPVELTSFSIQSINGKIELQWETATETNNKGFEVQRRINNSEWTVIQFIKGKGTSIETNKYSYMDDLNNISGKSIKYRLKQIDENGEYVYSKEILVDNLGITRYQLSQNYPNPFNPNTTISYQLPQNGIVTIKVYDILGNEVKTLVNENKQAGSYNVNFDASKLSSGVYVYKITVGNFVASRKMMLLK
ncbi:MAG: T9SS type A sorting domain-containing protein [Bacteroidota bacterium]|nr:T9SS type A sorting domain-containing protein [Bacteroidota bacterium]